MKVDLGFWNINGNYIPDIQELNEIERKEVMETKNFNEFFDELSDMANFKDFGEKEEEKEIIKDGVDVAGCNHCFEQSGDMLCMMIDQYFCEGNNCYYKQLKRLEQENAELKAENERLKALCDTYRTCYQAKHSDIKCLLPKYRQTLQEIKEFCKKEIEYFDNNDDYGQQADWIALLQIITKAEEE